jgi:excisionase family DNA binding protein
VEPHNFLTVAECAARCRASVDFVRSQIRSGQLRARCVGRRYLVAVEDFEAFLASCVVVAIARASDVHAEGVTGAALDLTRGPARGARHLAVEEPIFRSAREARDALLRRRGGAP